MIQAEALYYWMHTLHYDLIAQVGECKVPVGIQLDIAATWWPRGS